MIDFNKLYIMKDPISNTPYRGGIEIKEENEFSIIKGEYRPENPIIVRHQMGGAVPKDVIWNSMAGYIVVSQKVIDIFINEKFKGWDTYPVNVFSKQGDLVMEYYGLSITGRCGSIDYTKCKKFMKQYPAGMREAYRGMYFEPDTLDGSDIFLPSDGSVFKFVYEPVKNALTKAKIRNLKFEKATEIELHRSIVENALSKMKI